MRLTIRHRTRYAWDDPVAGGLQELRLTPKTGHGQQVLGWSVSVDGGRHELDFEDQHHNRVTLIGFEGPGHAITVTCSGAVATEDRAGVIGRHAGFAPLWYFERETPRTRPGPGLRKLARAVATDAPIPRLHALSAALLDAMAYETGVTGAGTTAEEALAQGAGVCQDHAHAFIACARLMGMPARYVSGYLFTDGQTRHPASHGWAEAWVPDIGWVGFDISNGVSPDARYVRVATGLDYAEAAPIRGLRFGGAGGETLSVDIEVAQQ
jgi:transglutaminase-like putative cysteine protease